MTNFSGVDYYDDYDFFEPVPSSFEIEMRVKGWDFITNFKNDNKQYIKRAAEVNHIEVFITDKVFSGFGTPLNDSSYLALYTPSNIYDLSNFWNTVEQLRNTRG